MYKEEQHWFVTENKFMKQSSGGNFTSGKIQCSRLVKQVFWLVGEAMVGRGVITCLPLLLTDCVSLLFLFVCLWSVFKADTHSGHSSTLSYRYPDEQRHTHAGARRRVRLRVPGREGLYQLLLLLRGLSLRCLATRPTAHPHRQDRLIRTYFLPHCLWPLQLGLLGLLPVPLGHSLVSSFLSFLFTL